MHISNYFEINSAEFLVIITILGLWVGSFLNVLIFRLPIIISNQNKLSSLTIPNKLIFTKNTINLWRPNSFCPHCKKSISFWANVPIISYLLLRGCCACCQQKISVRYLIVELFSGFLSILIALHFGYSIKTFCGLVFAWSFIALIFIDIDQLILPNQITLPILLLGLVINSFSLFTDPYSAVVGAIIGYLFFSLIAWIMLKIRKIEALGRGDFKLFAILGAWFGWQLLPAAILIASLLGSIIGIIYITSTKQRFNTHLPFGPFLAMAGFLLLFYGPEILNYQHYYMDLFPN